MPKVSRPCNVRKTSSNTTSMNGTKPINVNGAQPTGEAFNLVTWLTETDDNAPGLLDPDNKVIRKMLAVSLGVTKASEQKVVN